MRNVSFIYTEEQILNETKDITRRLGWEWAKPGMRVQACRKLQGRRKGQPIVPLKVIEIVSVRRERLNLLTSDNVQNIGGGKLFFYTPSQAKRECVREGFPDLAPHEFVAMFCRHMQCKPEDIVTRVEFKYVKE